MTSSGLVDQFSAAFAPFGFALTIGALGVLPALWVNVAVGLIGIGAFAAIAIVASRARDDAFAPDRELRPDTA